MALATQGHSSDKHLSLPSCFFSSLCLLSLSSSVAFAACCYVTHWPMTWLVSDSHQSAFLLHSDSYRTIYELDMFKILKKGDWKQRAIRYCDRGLVKILGLNPSQIEVLTVWSLQPKMWILKPIEDFKLPLVVTVRVTNVCVTYPDRDGHQKTPMAPSKIWDGWYFDPYHRIYLTIGNWHVFVLFYGFSKPIKLQPYEDREEKPNISVQNLLDLRAYESHSVLK